MQTLFNVQSHLRFMQTENLCEAAKFIMAIGSLYAALC